MVSVLTLHDVETDADNNRLVENIERQDGLAGVAE
ncbi:unnamed protein product, partial [marine sediment metagenome]